jgi:hypothetical protein
MDQNFWGYLVLGFTDILSNVLNTLPVSAPAPFLSAAILYYGIAPLLILVGSFMNLALMMTVIGAILVLEAARATVSLVRLAYKLIPMAA